MAGGGRRSGRAAALLGLAALAALAARVGGAAAARAAPAGRAPAGSWAEAAERARRAVAGMTLEEKLGVVGGTGARKYVGETTAVPRLGVPALHLQDGPQGVRTDYPKGEERPGTSTAWPCALAVAATFDPELVAVWGSAMAREFAGKGANVWLGPGLNVLRMPWNGRSFEYLSGEDPYLGAALVGPLVQAAQAEGVAATAKHFVGNTQETDRLEVDEVVDERTLQELYLPPFEAAVAADVAAFMCAYNRINGPYSCQNNATLIRTLRGDWGFQGWVMSDWGAAHASEDMVQGLDQEMPVANYFGEEKVRAEIREGRLAEADVDRAAARVLTGAFYAATEVEGSLDSNVTSEAHAGLARELAGASAVLLENSNALPLEPGLSVAVVGDAAHKSPIITGMGSGRVEPARVTSHLTGIRDAAGPGANVQYADSSDPQAAARLASRSQAAVVVVGVESGEGADRKSLSLSAADDALVAAVAATNPRTIVVVCAPGPVLMPWRGEVGAVVLTLFGGQEAGAGCADVLFGLRSPSGRLPFTVPQVEPTVSPAQFPGEGGRAVYSEKLRVGYRAYRDQPKEGGGSGAAGGGAEEVPPAYWFGHGLTYSQFVYSGVRAEGRAVRVLVTNVGARSATDVVQLYLTFPPGTPGEPAGQLRGFQSVELAPGDSREVQWQLDDRALSVWDDGESGGGGGPGWRLVEGAFTVHVGPDAGCVGRRAGRGGHAVLLEVARPQ